MDFFQHQDDARRKTGRMVVLFFIAVALIVVAMNGLIAAFYVFGGFGPVDPAVRHAMPIADRFAAVPPQIWTWTTAAVLLVIVFGSLFKIMQLSDGGQTVAEMIGARKVSRHTNDPLEKRLLNVVDEMAIASGTTVPQVYVMDNEPGINAFAAGYKANQAVVAVTRGCLEKLDRDELQGVVAHEFSHILNGDMRINIRLMGVLHGILVIGMLGGFLLRSALFPRYRYRGRNRGSGITGLLGLAMMIVGYVGVIFGRLIKAGISRQREFLADASAVQFTRSNDGLAGALTKIRAADGGSMIENKHAEEMSHMFFGASFPVSFFGMFATHPPLQERIRRVNRKYLKPDRASEKPRDAAPTPQPSPQAAAPADIGGVVGSVGNPGQSHIVYAAALLASIPQPVADTVSLQKGAQALMFVLVLDSDAKTRELEIQAIKKSAHAELLGEVARLDGYVGRLHPRYRLPLFDMAAPVLKDLPQDRRDALVQSVSEVINADRKIKLNELTMFALLKAHLGKRAAAAEPVKYKSFADLREETRMLLTLLAHLGKTDRHPPQTVFAAAAGELSAQLPDLVIGNMRDFEPHAFVAALEKFNLTPAAMKSQLLRACLKAVMHDGRASTSELEVVRGICATMDVPVPPIQGQGADKSAS